MKLIHAAQAAVNWTWALGHRAPSAIRAALTPQSLEEMLRHQLDGVASTASGAFVTPDRAMRVVAVFAAVRVLAESLAQVPLILYRRIDDKSKERATDHWLYRLLHVKPNAWQSSFEWREMMQAHAALRGNAYSFKVRVRGEIRELLPIHPDRVQVAQDDKWRLEYTVSLPDGSAAKFGSGDIFHLRGLSSNGYMGISPIMMAREAVGLAIETERHGAQLFGNGARPSGLLSTEQSLKPEQMNMIRDSWRESQGGDKRLGTAVLDGGMKYEQMGLSNEDAQFLETRKFQITEIARLFRVPPHMLADLERATFSNIEQQALGFVKYTMMPWYVRWEQAISLQLLPEADQDDLFAEFLVDGLLRGDIVSRNKAYEIGLRNAYLNPNEVRAMENRNPYEGGDEYRWAANVFGDTDESGDNNGDGNNAQNTDRTA